MAALALGADGVYMGTRLIASEEADVQKNYKKAIVDAGCEDIVNTDRVDGFPGNFIKTPQLEPVLKANLVESVLTSNKKVKRWVSLFRAGKSLLGSTEQKLSYKNVFSAGHGVGNIDEILPIQQIVQGTVREYRSLKKQMP